MQTEKLHEMAESRSGRCPREHSISGQN